MKPHKVTIKQRKGTTDKIMTGANTIIELDGKKLDGCFAAEFEVDARGVAKVHLSLYGTIDIKGNIKPDFTAKIINQRHGRTTK